MASNRSRSGAYALMLYGSFAIGCQVLAANTSLKSMIAEFGWTDAQGGLLISCMSIGCLVSGLFTGAISQRFTRKKVMLVYGLLLFFSFGLETLLGTPALFYPLMVLAGLFWGGVNNIVNSATAELYEGSTAKLNLLGVTYGVGAVLVPLVISALLLAGVSWRVSFAFVALLGLGFAVLSLFIPVPEPMSSTPSGEHVSFWKELPFYIGLVLLFCYVGVETAAAAWIPSYLSQVDPFFQHVPSETMVSLLWLMLIVGRTFLSIFAGKFDCRKLLIMLASGFLLGMLGLVAFAGCTPMLILSVAFMGLGMSGLYGTCVANTNRYISFSPMGSGLLFSMSGLGGAAIPYLAGLVSDHSGIRAGMGSLCVFLAILLVFAVLNLVVSRKKAAA